MSHSILIKALQELGLQEFEAKTYILLTQIEELNIAQMAKTLNTNRVRIYEALKRLEVAEIFFRKENGDFDILPPSSILARLRHKQTESNRLIDDLNDALPALTTSYYNTSKQPSTKIYEGKDKFLKLILEIFEEIEFGNELLWFAEGEEFYHIIDSDYFLGEISRLRLQKQVPVRALALQNNFPLRKIKENDQKSMLRQIKFLPKDVKTRGTITVFGNKIINWNTVLAKAIVIDDKIIADTYRALFDLLWEQSEE
jgi:sugar-specific transcriptional regulator TrmB